MQKYNGLIDVPEILTVALKRETPFIDKNENEDTSGIKRKKGR